MDIAPLEDQNDVPISGIQNDQSGQEKEEAICQYKCRTNGGCSVRIESNRPVTGNVVGSCFSPDFGGFCSGTPEKCDKCSIHCEGRFGQDLSLPAKYV